MSIDQEPLTLAGRITAVLTANGFGSFDVAEGTGATVGVSAELAEGERAVLLAVYAARLRAGGLVVEQRARYLYVTGG